jgi:hypothetical protein
MTGSSFVAPRAESKTAYVYAATTFTHDADRSISWLYRIRPSVAHKGFTPLAVNPDVRVPFLSHSAGSKELLIHPCTVGSRLFSHESTCPSFPYPTCVVSIRSATGGLGRRLCERSEDAMWCGFAFPARWIGYTHLRGR